MNTKNRICDKEINKFQESLYEDLMLLTSKHEMFSFKDHICDDGIIYRMFNYRLMGESYDVFLEKNALNCRGTTFHISSEGDFKGLVSLPFDKFFNINENPLTTGLNLSNVVGITNKVDGSMVSSYLHDGEVMLKTKNGITSPQAIAAMEFLRKPQNRSLYDDIYHLELEGYTVIFEWTSPSNIGVLIYEEDKLTTIGIRSRYTGDYLSYNDISTDMSYSELCNNWVDFISIEDGADINDYISNLRQSKYIEGVVLLFANGLRVKCKTAWYVELHKISNDINNKYSIIKGIIDGNIDDVISLVYYNKSVLNYLNYMNTEVCSRVYKYTKYLDAFYRENKELSNYEYYKKISNPIDVYVLSRMHRGLVVDVPTYMYKNRNYFFEELSSFDEFIK